MEYMIKLNFEIIFKNIWNINTLFDLFKLQKNAYHIHYKIYHIHYNILFIIYIIIIHKMLIYS